MPSRFAAPALASAGLALLAFACGGDTTPVTDSGTDAGPDAGPLVTAPNIPWLEEGVPPVRLTPCPEGWREVHGRDVVECDPYPEAGAEACSPGEAHFPGEAGCRSVGDPCPSDDFAEALPSDGTVVYVHPDAAAGGDGSRGAPYASLPEVPWLSLAGATVALSKGRHTGTLPLRAGTRVVGACSRDTILTGASGPFRSVVSVTSAGAAASLRNVALVDTPIPAVIVDDGRSLSIEGVSFSQIPSMAISALGAGTELQVSDVVIDGVYDSSARGSGQGIDVESGARVTASHIIIAHAANAATWTQDVGTELLLTDAVLRDTAPAVPDPGSMSVGTFASRGSRTELSRVLIVRSQGAGVLVRDDTMVSLSDVMIMDTLPWPYNGSSGTAIRVEAGGKLDGSRVVIAAAHYVGVEGWRGSEVSLTDLVVRDAPQSSAGPGETGAGIVARGQVHIERALVRDNLDIGVHATRGGRLTLVDAVVRNTGPEPEVSPSADARSLTAVEGSYIEVNRALLSIHASLGVVATDPDTEVVLEDVLIGDVEGLGPDAWSGRGIQAQYRARVEGRRLRVEGATGLGAASLGGASITLSDVSLEDVRTTPCTGSACAIVPPGMGAVAGSASMTMTRFLVSDAEACGVAVADLDGWTELGSVDLATGTVRGSTVGVCLQTNGGYDTDRLTRDVAYLDNDTNLDATELPIPQLPPEGR